MKKRKLRIVIAVAAYLSLLLLLLLAETGADGATIRSFPEAIWYSLVTMTTVGYGDTYPVTLAGRMIGVLFLLASVTVFATLIAGLSELMRTQIGWRLTLRLRGGRDWYIFTERNGDSEALAENIRKEFSNAEILFSTLGTAASVASPASGEDVPFSVEKLLSMQQKKHGCFVFCMAHNGFENYRRAIELSTDACGIYCQTEFEPDVLNENIHLFNPFDCCARIYWEQHPLSSPDEIIVLIGSGRYADAILKHALATNVIDPNQHVAYHVFGDGTFQREHPFLNSVFAVNTFAADTDSVCFHDEHWSACLDVMEQASRVILCEPSENDTLALLNDLTRCCDCLPKTIHARLPKSIQEATVFGSPDVIFTPDLVMQKRLNEIGRRLHENYRASVGEENCPAWAELGRFKRDSNLASADHLLLKARILLGRDLCWQSELEEWRKAAEKYEELSRASAERFRQIEHLRWMRFHFVNNWRYAPERDDARRRHNGLLPYDKLPETLRARNDDPWKLLRIVPDLIDGRQTEAEEAGKRDPQGA